MKNILAGLCGIGLLVTFVYTILGLFPAWSVIIPLLLGKGLVK